MHSSSDSQQLKKSPLFVKFPVSPPLEGFSLLVSDISMLFLECCYLLNKWLHVEC